MLQDRAPVRTCHGLEVKLALLEERLPHPLYKYVHHAAADLIFAIERFREVHGHDPGLAVFDDGHGFLPDFRFATATANGAEEGAVLADHHLRASLAGSAPPCAGYGSEDDGFAAFNSGQDFSVDLILHV